MDPIEPMPIEPMLIDRMLRLRQRLAPFEQCPGLAIVSTLAAGTADERTIREASLHLESCESCRLTLRVYRSLAEQEAPIDPAPVSPARSWDGRLGWGFASLAAAGLLALVVWLWPASLTKTPAGLEIKGAGDSLAIAVARGEQRFTAQLGEKLLTGDRLGFFYSAVHPGYLVLFHLENSGQTTQLFPWGRSGMAPIVAGENLVLPDNAILRDKSGCEWLVAIFAEHDVPTPGLVDWLARQAQATRAGCELRLTHPETRTVWVFPLW